MKIYYEPAQALALSQSNFIVRSAFVAGQEIKGKKKLYMYVQKIKILFRIINHGTVGALLTLGSFNIWPSF